MGGFTGQHGVCSVVWMLLLNAVGYRYRHPCADFRKKSRRPAVRASYFYEGLKLEVEVLEVDFDRAGSFAEGEGGVLEAGGSHEDFGVVGEAKPFFGDAEEVAVEDAVVIGVVEDGDRVGAEGKVVECEGGLTGADVAAIEGGMASVGEACGAAEDAEAELAVLAFEASDVDGELAGGGEGVGRGGHDVERLKLGS